MINKLYEMVNYVLAKLIKPDLTIENVAELDYKTIEYLKIKYNIEGIILDVDKTLRKNMKKIPQCNEEWLRQIKQQLKIIVVSNGIDKNIEKFLKDKGINYICFAIKPLRMSFKKACKKMKISPENVLVVGDSLISDIYGGKRNNMISVLVKNVDEGERS